MRSVERTLCAISGERYDRPPVIPLLIQHTMEVSGIPHSIYSRSAEHMAQAQIAAWRQYGCDGLHITTDNQVIAEAMGSELHFPYDEPPQYRHRVLQEGLDLSRLTEPDPQCSGRMPVILAATRLVRQELGEQCFLKVNCDSGPFSIAAALRGEEAFFLDLYDAEQAVFDLLEITTRAMVRYASAIARQGAHAITFGDSTAGLLSREQYARFALPFTRQAIAEIKKLGLPVFLHICGNVRNILDLMAGSGADVLEIDAAIPLTDAYAMTGRRICLEGNVSTGLLWQGTPQEVRAAADACIQAAGGRYLILSSGCEVPRQTPPANIRALAAAAREAAVPQ